MGSFSLNQVSQQDFRLAQMHSRVILTDVYVYFQRLLLQECNIEVINFILERKLCLVVRLESFSHLRGLRCVIVEV